jgi:hypothetical protein
MVQNLGCCSALLEVASSLLDVGRISRILTYTYWIGTSSDATPFVTCLHQEGRKEVITQIM